MLAAVDWCEIRNDAYDRWRRSWPKPPRLCPSAFSSAASISTTPRSLTWKPNAYCAHKAKGSICDTEFHERAVQSVARAVRAALKTPERLTHIGIGQARVEKVASNRRYLDADGKPRFGRTSATRDAAVREKPEGIIDPWLKTLSFWDGDRPLVSLSCYATHPMSYYGKGGVSSDFMGLARKRRQADEPKTAQIYMSGCSGNVTAGKYNDGSLDNRPILAERMYKGMVNAWKATKKHPLDRIQFRSTEMRLEPRASEGFTKEDLTRRLTNDPKPFGQCLAALGLSWRERADAGHKIDVPMLDFGVAQLVLLPAESYVEYQLLAQRLRPDSFVVVAGYGECAPGYIPTEKAVDEGDTNLHDWCWVAPGAETSMKKALVTLLQKP